MLRIAAAAGLLALVSMPAASNAAIDIRQVKGGVAASEAAQDDVVIHDCSRGSNVLRKLMGCSALIKSGDASGTALSRAYKNRGMAYFSLGEKQRAIDDFGRALRLDPENATLYYVRGTAWQQLGEHGRAAEDLGRAIELDPANGAAYANRGVAWEKLGEDERALTDYDRALELDPENVITLNNRGNVLARLGQRGRAVEDYDTAIRIDPDYAAAYYNRAGERCLGGMVDTAVADYLHAIRLGTRERDTMQQFLVSRGYDPALPLEDAVRRWGQQTCGEPARPDEPVDAIAGTTEQRAEAH